MRRLGLSLLLLILHVPALVQAADRLLWIGDSHSGENRLSARYFELWPMPTSWFSVSGSNSRHWLNGSFRGLHYGALRFLPRQGDRQAIATVAPEPPFSFEQLVRSERPTHVVFALGTNDAVGDCRSPVTQESAPVRLAMRARALGLKCLWVAPTLQNWDASNGRANNLMSVCGGARYASWVSALKQAVLEVGCGFFDSSRLRLSRSRSPRNFAECISIKDDLWLPDDGEKLHFRSSRAYAQWMDCLNDSPEWTQFLR